MSVIVEYELLPAKLALAETLATVDVRLSIEQTVGTDPTEPVLFMWAEGDLAAFDAALADDPTAASPTVLSDHGDRRLYRVDATDAVETVLYPLWVDLGGEGLEARYEGDWWHSRVRFPDREAVSAYRERVRRNDVAFRLEGLYEEHGLEPAITVSPEQREALRLAYRRGYFSVPREATTAELAGELDISTQAVSERLRRGYARLVESHLALDRVDGEE